MEGEAVRKNWKNFDEATLEKIKSGSVGRVLITKLDAIKANKLPKKQTDNSNLGTPTPKKFFMQECVAHADSMVTSILSLSRTIPDKKLLNLFSRRFTKPHPELHIRNSLMHLMALKGQPETAINTLLTEPPEKIKFMRELFQLKIRKKNLLQNEILRLKKKYLLLGREV